MQKYSDHDQINCNGKNFPSIKPFMDDVQQHDTY